ncbi:MAG TPA: hypothetical protein VLL05_05500 [Terriglobales bacterium]|nr:hypothetical protein [Terriglobales bacterium]
MTLLGIIALIVLVIAGLMVLRVKSDPSEAVRKYVAESKNSDGPPQP